MRLAFLILALAGAYPALADEGMWTFDNFPAAAVQKTYGVKVTEDWFGSRAPVDCAARELHRLVRFPRRPHSDESPLRGIVPRGAFVEGS